VVFSLKRKPNLTILFASRRILGDINVTQWTWKPVEAMRWWWLNNGRRLKIASFSRVEYVRRIS